MKKILLAAFLLFAGIITTASVHAQTEKQPVLIPTAPPAVLERISQLTYFFESLGLILTSNELYVEKGVFIWKITFLNEQGQSGAGSFGISPQGKTVY